MPAFPSVFALSSLNGINGFKIAGEAAEDASGIRVSNAGDVNGDGFDDIIIGAGGASEYTTYDNASYIVFGKSQGLVQELSFPI